MKILFTAFVVVACVIAVSAQQQSPVPDKLTTEQWDLLFSALEGEKWKEAFDLSSKYIETLKNDDNADSIENLRYILIYSAAGSVSDGDMSYDDLEKQLPKAVGKKVALPFHPVGVECHSPMFNYVCRSDGKEHDVMITSSNSTATTIFAFEYIDLAKDFDFEKHQGEMATVIGTVDRIEPNPNRSNLLIMRIFIKDAEIKTDREIQNEDNEASESEKNL